MPLSDAAERTPLHTRAITLNGFARADGLFDVEGSLVDTKSYGFSNFDRGDIAPGEPLHHMRFRVTFNDELRVVSAEAVTEQGPYDICPGGAESFGRLAGLQVGPGFLKTARERLAGTAGCTHLRELLQQIATTAYQTIGPVLRRRADDDAKEVANPKRMIDSCHAYASDREPVRRRWPAFYTGSDAPAAKHGD